MASPSSSTLASRRRRPASRPPARASSKGRSATCRPSRIRQGAVGPTTDVYALAVVLWEMLTAHRLFSGATEPAVLAQVLDGASTRPGALVAEDPGRGRGHRHARPRARPLDAVSVRAGDGRGPRGAGARGQPSRRGGRRERAGADDAGGPRGRHAAHPRQCIGRGHRAAAGGDISLADGTLSGRRDGSGARPASPPIELPIGPGVDERQKEAGSRGTRAVVLLAATAGAMTCVAAIVALANRGSVPTGTAAGTMAAAPPGQSATPPDRATAALPSAVPSLAQIANATASGVAPQVSAAPAASTRRASATLAPTAPVPPAVTPPRPPRPRPAPTLDCAQNPRVLGPDGVYQVRKECLGR